MNTSKFAGPKASTNGAQEVPEKEYARRLNKRKRQLANLGILHWRLWACLAAGAITAMVLTSAALSQHLISMFWILVPSVAVLSALRSLGKNARLHRRVERIINFYELGVARLSHQWQGRGIGGIEFRPATHSYASDLDLFGTGSLFELLCTARTSVGRTTLANWLLEPAEYEEIAERQKAVAELRDALELREGWASVDGRAEDQTSASVRDWASAPALVFPLYGRVLAILLPISLIVLLLLGGAGIIGRNWPYAVAVVAALEALLATLFRKRTKQVTANLITPVFELELLAPLLARFEVLCFQSPLLKSLKSQLTSSSGRPSKQIHRLRVLAWLLDLRQIEYFALLASPILWETNLAILIERWRHQNREPLARWLHSLGQFEALLCLARYCYENPDHTFAVLKRESPPMFEAEDLGHPLLDRRVCVRCDVQLAAKGTQVLIASGSNMSGKSTLLRSVGLNSVLAMAGAPVCAARLQMSLLEIGCSIAIHDSLLEAKSRFQAEVERLTWILTLSRKNRLLFLLDEMLGGTNSADRLFGARAVIEQLAANEAVGIVTTHDLALTEMAQALDGQVINVHFEEHYEDGEMRFDYQMRPGALTRTNGVNVMAALGLLPLEKGAGDATHRLRPFRSTSHPTPGS